MDSLHWLVDGTESFSVVQSISINLLTENSKKQVSFNNKKNILRSTLKRLSLLGVKDGYCMLGTF